MHVILEGEKERGGGVHMDGWRGQIVSIVLR